VYNCFDVPKVRFDHIRQRFYPWEEPLSIHATAQVSEVTPVCLSTDALYLGYNSALQDRYSMYLDRLLLLHQRLRRDKTFSRPALALSDTDEQNAYCQVNRQCALYGNCFQQSCRTAAMLLVVFVFGCLPLAFILLVASLTHYLGGWHRLQQSGESLF